jgi:hypothetical protein
MRIRANSVLVGLTEDQLNKIYDWKGEDLTPTRLICSILVITV